MDGEGLCKQTKQRLRKAQKEEVNRWGKGGNKKEGRLVERQQLGNEMCD